VFRTGDGVTRRVTEVYEIDRIESGRAVGRTLHRWRRETDTFDTLAEPQNFAHDRKALTRRREVIQALVDTKRTSTEDVEAAVKAFRA
jgi:hypothetical protein